MDRALSVVYVREIPQQLNLTLIATDIFVTELICYLQQRQRLDNDYKV